MTNQEKINAIEVLTITLQVYQTSFRDTTELEAKINELIKSL